MYCLSLCLQLNLIPPSSVLPFAVFSNCLSACAVKGFLPPGFDLDPNLCKRTSAIVESLLELPSSSILKCAELTMLSLC